MLPLIFLILALARSCFMAPIWSDDFTTSFINRNDDDFDMFDTNYNDNELPETNLIFTPMGIFFKTVLNSNELDDLFKNDDIDNDDDDIFSNFSPDMEKFPSNTKTIYPLDIDKQYSFNPNINVDNINNNYDGIDEIDPSTINQSYLKSLMDTISIIYKLNEMIKSLDDDEQLLLTDAIKGLDDDEKLITNDDNDDGIIVIGNSNINPNVNIKLAFDKFDDDNNDNIDNDNKNEKDNDNKDDDKDDNNSNVDNDEVTTTKYDDETPDLKKNLDDILEPELLENKFVDIDHSYDDSKELLTNQITKNSINNDIIENTIELTTTSRPTEWDESDEISKSFINEENLNFVSFDDSDNTVTMTVQPEYKLVN